MSAPTSPRPSLSLDEYATDVRLKDGRTVHIRPIRSDDTERMLAMWSRLSPETIRLRFFSMRSMDERQMRYFTELDYANRFALVAETGGDIVGVSRFDKLPENPRTAEFAVLVEDAWQGRGVGTALLRGLMDPAGDLGVEGFVGEVLRENSRMLRVMRDAGLQPGVTDEGSVVTTTFSSTPTEAYLQASDEQDRTGAAAALTSVFHPSSVAVVGASRDRRRIGGLVFDNLLRGGFQGTVYPVNPTASSVQSVAAYASLADLPATPELVVVCVPAPLVCDVVEEAGRLGANAVVVVSAGFSEAGQEGEERERELLGIARRHGLAMVGPNCMGVLNANPSTSMNATFSQVFPPAGRVAFSSQSGALGLAILSAAQRLGVGLSSFASIGNKADISGNDLLQYWEHDPDTDVILLYVESFGNPRKFGRIARRVGRQKPIAAVKSGRTSAGERAASSHTGALAAGDVAVEALFRQAGVIRTDTMEELFSVAQMLANQPVPRSGRVAILTNGGGPGILAADACESNGLSVPELARSTIDELASFLPAEAGIRNPVDMIASASAQDYGRAMRVLADDPDVDALLVIFIPPVVTEPDDVAQQMAEAQRAVNEGRADDERVPVVGVFMSEGSMPQTLRDAGIPAFRFPEDAARPLGHVARYGEWRRRPLGDIVTIDDADVEQARAVVEEALGATDEADVWLDARQTDRLLSAFRITTAPARLAHTPEEAAQAQRELDATVAIKLAAPEHKTDLGGVELGIADPEQAAEAVQTMSERVRGHDRSDLLDAGFLVQEMVGDGVEMVVGVTYDDTFGQLLLVGMGGTLVELLADVAVRIHPLTDLDVDEMVTSLRGFPLLTGYRGSEPMDVAALKTLLLKVSAMVEEVPELDEVDLNPLFVRRHGVAAVDARIKLSRTHQRRRR